MIAMLILAGTALTPGEVVAGPSGLNYPETPSIPVAETLHDTVVVDGYRWLENSADSLVRSWTADQNKLSRSFLDALPQRAHAVGRLTELIRYDKQGMPFGVPDGPVRFHWRQARDQEKPVWHVQERERLPARVVFDANTLEIDEQLLEFSPSRDGKYVALAIARGGNEDARIRVMDVAAGRFLTDTLPGPRQHGVSWVVGNVGFYYTSGPQPGSVPQGDEAYWHTVYFHRLGTRGSDDKRVFGHDSVREYWHICQVSEDGRYALFLRADVEGATELFVQRLDTGDSIRPVATGMDGTYGGALADTLLLVMTDAGAPMGRVYATHADQPQREYWREFAPEMPDAHLVDVRPIGGRVYLIYERQAHTVVRIHELDGRFVREMPLPTLGTASVEGTWKDDEVRVNFSSFTYPGSQFYYDFTGDSLKLFFQPQLGIRSDRYVTDLVWYKSKDGTPVSMFLVHKKDAIRDGWNAVLLMAYGGFGISCTAKYQAGNVAWLEAGGLVAVAHVRGGGEYGRNWHEAGKFAGRQKTFEDLIAAAEWLVAEKYTSPERIAAVGASNGGLTVAASMIQRPELFRAVVLDVALLDMLRYHKLGPGGLWANEYGTADDPAQFRYLAAYSPYQNVRPRTHYPAVLLSGSENDYRVDPSHTRKMAARMQALNPQGEPVLLLVEGASGHLGGTTETIQIEQLADPIAFLMNMLGMPAPRVEAHGTGTE